MKYYDVKASSVDAARNKAIKEWKAENGPSVCAVEEEATS